MISFNPNLRSYGQLFVLVFLYYLLLDGEVGQPLDADRIVFGGRLFSFMKYILVKNK